MITEKLMDSKILIVDDQESNVLLLEQILTRDGYTNLKRTTDSREVLPLYHAFQPDLILLDLAMPHLDGFEVMQQLRGVTPSETFLPILVLTADITPEAKKRALTEGAKDFLTKPFDQIEVLLRIKNLLGTRALHVQQQKQNEILEEKVRERTAQLTKSNAEIERQVHRLSALRAIDQAITASFDLPFMLQVFLGQVTTQLNVDAAAVLLMNREALTLESFADRGFRTPAIKTTRLGLGKGFAGKAAGERRMVVVPDIRSAPNDCADFPTLIAEGFIGYCAAPLIAKGKVQGVLEVFQRAPLDPPLEWQSFLGTLADQGAIAVDNATLFENLQRSNTDLLLAYDATIEGWSRAMDLRDKETEGHTLRVTELALQLARAMGMNEEELVHVRRGGLLHDIGKMGVPDGILLKPGKLTDEEWAQMRKHPQFAYDMLAPIAYLKFALDIPYCHHEKWDGTGYPRGLKGEAIPLAARVFAIVDVYDALMSDRPYRAAWSKEKTLEHIQSLSGAHFEPRVVEAFLRLLRAE
ncbi:MAG: response regulator [Chloroflexi bacterium]|nr:response regulator [Chloroflexota bacterium]